MRSHLRKHRNKQSGQLMVALLVSMVLFTGGTLLWGYMEQINTRASSLRTTGDLQIIVSNVVSRIRQLIVRDGPAGCTSFSNFRDFTPPADPNNPPPITLILNPSPPAAIPANECILTAAEAAQLSSIFINVTRVGEASLVTHVARIRVDVEARGIQSADAPTNTYKISRSFNLKIAKMSNFNVVIGAPGPGAATAVSAPLVEVTSGAASASLEFFGKVFFSQKTRLRLSEVTSIPAVGNNPKVIFNRTVYLRSDGVRAEPAGGEINMANVKRIFRSGVEPNTLANVVALPFPSTGEYTAASNQTAWDQDIDYGYMYETPALATRAPLPNLTSIGGTSYTHDHNAPPPTAAQPFTLARANVIRVPEPTKRIYNLEDTCSAYITGGSDAIPTFVYQRYRNDFTIDFTGHGGAGQPKAIFCGIVAANQLNIVTPAAGDYAIFGIFYVAKIQTSGPGRVLFYAPSDNLPSQVTLPTNQSAYNMHQQHLALMYGRAHNFFVPLFWNYPGVVGALDVNFTPRFPVDASSNNYMETCPPPLTANDRCVNQLINPPNYQSLFPGATSTLAFTLEESS